MMKIFAFTCAAALSLSAFAEKPANSPANQPELGTNEKSAGWGNTCVVKYPTTTSVFYGSAIDTSKDWNICTGATDGGVEVHMVQRIVPVQYCPGEYAVVRVYSLPDGTFVKQQIKRLFNIIC